MPSCQTSDSSWIAPVAAFRLSCATRIGPTGTPLIAAYHSLEVDTRRPVSSFVTVFWKAPASALSGRAAGAAGFAGFAEARLVASDLVAGAPAPGRGLAGFVAAPAGPGE